MEVLIMKKMFRRIGIVGVFFGLGLFVTTLF